MKLMVYYLNNKMNFKSVVLLLIGLCLFSCYYVKKDVKEELVLEMYEPSEMSLLMKEMFELNKQIKLDILDGKIPENFPIEFLEIHTAGMSEFKDRNETFETYSKLFLKKEQSIFETTSHEEAKERFNQAINLCITCHQTECTGPIPRIKKLLIK